jgi:hypothetical protein
MRVLAIPALLLFAAATIAPLAAADPACTTDLCGDPNEPPSCYEKTIGPATTQDDCSVIVSVPLMSCPISGSWKEYHVGANVVRVYTCDSP